MKGKVKEVPAEKQVNLELSNEFKKDIIGERKNIKWSSIAIITFIVIVVFGSLGLGVYQIFYKKNTIEIIAPADKITSTPKDNQQEQAPAPTTQAPVETPVPAAQPDYIEYTVVSGDTWSSVANSHDMGSTKLMEYNGASTEDLQIGQVIKIPKQ